jgi:RNA recognition motif-containing protein
MKILVPRITDATKRKDLLEFANRVLQKWFRLPFSDRTMISSCRILAVEDSMGVTRRYGVLDVTPDDAATRVIRKLNGAMLCGKRVGVKHYDAAAARTIAQSENIASN